MEDLRLFLLCTLFLLSLLNLYNVPVYGQSEVQLGDSTLEDAETKEELENTVQLCECVDKEASTSFHIGGALRFNYNFRDWSQAHKKNGGDFSFDTWRINVDGQSDGILLSLEYRFYSGYHMFHHGWFGYDIKPGTQIQLGINQVPFGILPYASHSWFFQTPYYVGLEDDYDMGVKLTNRKGPIHWDLAFYKTAEPTISGSSLESARYSYDVVPASIISRPRILNPNTPGPDQDTIIYMPSQPDTTLYGANEEVNQFNGRLNYNISEQFQIGLSGQVGGIYNRDVDQTGLHWAGAAHLNRSFGPFNLLAEYIYYSYDLPSQPGISGDQVVMGAYDYPYYVAAKAQMFVAGLSYTLNTEIGPISSFTFYNNYTYTDKIIDGFANTQQNAFGVLVSAGQLYTYIDIASGKNHPWLGPFENNWNRGLAKGAVNEQGVLQKPKWHTRLNINFGFYF